MDNCDPCDFMPVFVNYCMGEKLGLSYVMLVASIKYVSYCITHPVYECVKYAFNTVGDKNSMYKNQKRT